KARQGDRQPDPSAATRDDDAPASTTTTPSGPTSEPTPTTATTTTSPPPTTTTAPPAPLIGGPFRPEVERWRGLVAAYFPAERVDEALAVLGCESNGDPNAYNPYSGASGLFQFLPATWATVSPSAGFSESSVFDAEANLGTAAWLSSYFESRGASPWSPWTCRPWADGEAADRFVETHGLQFDREVDSVSRMNSSVGTELGHEGHPPLRSKTEERSHPVTQGLHSPHGDSDSTMERGRRLGQRQVRGADADHHSRAVREAHPRRHRQSGHANLDQVPRHRSGNPIELVDELRHIE